ncbi:MAG: ABC transporter permease [Gemmatimonadales bacterium]|nr:ABC transporter permease [Gemmatimonadales bacterium]
MSLGLAFRHLRKSPLVTGVAVASLALGIGANAAIYSLLDQMLLRPLPVVEPDRLVNLEAPGPKRGRQACGQIGDCQNIFSYPMFQDLQREQRVFSALAAHVGFAANISSKGVARSEGGLLVSGSYFQVLGLNPALGRLIGPDDAAKPGDGRVVVLSHEYWRSVLGADAGVIGKTIIVNGQSLEVIGVTPPTFRGTTLGFIPGLFVPITMYGSIQPGGGSLEDRKSYWVYLFARLKEGISMERATSDLAPTYRAILEEVEVPQQLGMSDKTMSEFRSKPLVLAPGARGQSSFRAVVTAPLAMLFGVTFLVLLIACANISNLLLARGAARASEMTVRLALGATRRQLLGQLLTESAVLAAAGVILGLVVAVFTLRYLGTVIPERMTATFLPTLDLRVIGFAALTGTMTALLFGLFPAFHATRPDLIGTIREQGGQASGGRAAARWRTALATAQVGLAMALLASAGLFAKSLANISRVDLGIDIEQVISFRVSPELNGYGAERSQQLFHRVFEVVAATPGVTGVSAGMVPLLGGSSWGNDVAVEGFPNGPDIDNNSAVNVVGPGYFATLGIPILAGREFAPSDALGAPRVAVVNQAFAKKFDLGANPVGRRMDRLDGTRAGENLDIEIIGLVQDAKYDAVKDAVPPLFAIPYAQDTNVRALTFYARTAGDPRTLAPVVGKAVQALDATLPVEELRTMPEQIRENVFLDRLVSLFALAFAVLATLLAAIGLYGVLAFTVVQRTREFGVRMALGASPFRLLRTVLREVGMMTLVGGVLGLFAALGIGRAAESLLFQLRGNDPTVMLLSAAALSVVAFCAGLIPAFRASRLEPMRALRHE